MSHSKRNTSRPVFTSHERALAKSNWGASTARLSRESFLPFGSCGLCLGIARDPVSCRRGDIFCRECALANILSQKKDIKRAEKARRNAAEENVRAQVLEDEEDQQRAVRDFELTQAGLDRAKDGAKKPTVNNEQEDTPAAAGTKRKFSLDNDELERIAREDKIKARKAIDDEKAAKPTLPSFWTPSVAPDLNTNKLPSTEKKTKTIPTCPGSNAENPHSLTMQNLITINFNEETDSSSETKRRTCPSCLKILSNSSNPMMVKQCGHAICSSCVKQFMLPAKKSSLSSSEPQIPPTCYVCDTPLSTKAGKDDTSASSSIPGLVALKSDGTGFSARGSSTVEKSTVSFQC